MTTESGYCGGGCGKRAPLAESSEPKWFCCYNHDKHSHLNPFYCSACWGKQGNCGPGPQNCADVTSQAEATTRGERSQVECPDCDTWVVLAPNEKVDEGMEVGRRAALEHYGSQPLKAARALYGICSKCEAHIALLVARTGAAAPATA